MQNLHTLGLNPANRVAGLVLIVTAVLTAYLAGCGSSPPREPVDASAAQGRPSSDLVKEHYVCYRATEPIVIDGRVDEQAWQHAPWTHEFVDIEGDVKPIPRFRTRAKMLWDDEYFYVSAVMEEPHVWGTLTEHDQIVFHDNDFEIFIDPDGDTEEYYEIEVNVLNTIFDLFLVKSYINGGPALHDWNLEGLRTAIHVDGTLNDPSDTDQGWSVEFAMPWTALAEYANRPSPPEHGDTWRVNFSRVEWQHDVVDGDKYVKRPDTPENNWVWSPQGKINMHLPEMWGFVEFSTSTTAP